MINVSEQLKSDCNSESLRYREYIVVNGTIVDVKARLYQTAYKDTHFIGTFNLGYIKFTTENDIDYKGKEFDYYKEVNRNTFKVGHFIVTEVTDNDTKEEVSVTAYDNGIRFANEYQTELNYASGTVTLFQVLQECCEKCGVALKNESITNGNFIVTSNQFVNGEMYGDVISAIAYITGDFATINDSGELELIFYKETTEIIEDYVELEDKRDTHIITCVSLGMSDVEGENVVLKDDALIAQYGENWLIINDDPFAYTQEKRTQLITAIFNKVKGFGYSAFTSKYAFKPYLQLGDRIQFKNKAGELVSSVILRIETNYENVTLSAPSIINASVKYEQQLSAIELAKQTEIQVNKNTQEISSVAERVGRNETNITRIDQNIENINASVKLIGGNNKQRNSLGAYGTNNFEQSEEGTIVATEQELLKTTTDNGFGRIIYIDSQKWFKFKSESLVIGDTYTLSFKYSNTADNHCVINFLNNNTTTLVDKTTANDLTNVEYTFIANTEFVELYVSTGQGTVGITDYYLQTGNVANKWQPASGEALSTVLSIYYNGIQVSSENSEIVTNISNLGFSVTNNNGKVLITFNKDKCILSDTEINGTLEIKPTDTTNTGSWKTQARVINRKIHLTTWFDGGEN